MSHILNRMAYAAWQEAVQATATADNARHGAVAAYATAPETRHANDAVSAYATAAVAAAVAMARFDAIGTIQGVDHEAYHQGRAALASMREEALETAAETWRRVCDFE